ncbi:MAG: hypothetical protein M3364_00070 [Actinomycetota bacterium]|nr:hypothetical protein [Actinomycetota bacterium]
MARRATSGRSELPPPLPPERRTVGQLVGEAIRLYAKHPWKALALGLPVALVNAIVWGAPGSGRITAAVAGAFLVTGSYVVACSIVTQTPLRSRNALVAYVLGVLVFVPFAFLVELFVLPGLIWLSLFGLAVPVALVEGLRPRDSLVRALLLARADFVHVLGGLATLAIVAFLTQAALFFVLRELAENTRVAAAALASIVVSPVVFLGAALLYVDQEARMTATTRRRIATLTRRTGF